ncbi:MAG TPA: hypothetical protein PLD59_13630 [Tepidisphaeraceae bacterium]|nr:hypothetical protein [Tepidisphaeraceae bacterium]
MTKQERKDLPAPHHSYERADPKAESGMGDLDRDKSTPTNRPDSHQNANGNRPGGKAPTNEEPSGHPPTGPAPMDEEIEVGIGQEPNTEAEIQGSMHTEPLLGEDLMPTDSHDPQQKRHPRTSGKGGVERDAVDKRE